MANGIIAIRGFDYQTTVILGRILDHFDQHGSNAWVRPEGKDDLDLSWIENGIEHRRFEQIKKPKEDSEGNPKPAPWTLAEVANELLPNTLSHLSGAEDEQVWILGDDVDDDVRGLINAGQNAPSAAASPYWKAIHLLARVDSLKGIAEPLRTKLMRWRVPNGLSADPSAALDKLTHDFELFTAQIGCSPEASQKYTAKVRALHQIMPDILARTRVEDSYGSDGQVRKLAQDRLENRYKLSPEVISRSLFGNLCSYIYDVSKEANRKFGKQEFEGLVRRIWPHMISIKEPPALGPHHVRRPDIVDHTGVGWSGRALEIKGISGSGKTSLAAEALERSRATEPDRLAYYVEVRTDDHLRDVLAGVSYEMWRAGFDEAFSISIESGVATEELLGRFARSFAALPKAPLILFDLVEGACNPSMARDLAQFVRSLSPDSCRFVIFGQESAARDLTALEKDQLGVAQLDVRGFSFEEFVTLIRMHHADPDHQRLHQLYHDLTRGRAAGLFAKLAESVAEAKSLDEMAEIASRSPEDILALAEQQRFARLTAAAKPAAEKLVCFALPYSRVDAEGPFPSENVGAAIREMLDLGLLRRQTDNTYEMHETVRKGLEGTIATQVRRSAHQALACWYGNLKLTSAEVFHLDAAGQHDLAKLKAREAFLEGRQWYSLSSYVTRHKLVTAAEVIEVISGPDRIGDEYLLPSILSDLKGAAPVDELIGMLRKQPDRIAADHNWAKAIFQSILQSDSDKLHELIEFCVDLPEEPAKKESTLAWLRISAGRKSATIELRTLEYFERQPKTIKRLLVPLILLDHRPEVLSRVFQFLASDDPRLEDFAGHSRRHEISLRLDTRDEVVAFLTALPLAEPGEMIKAKSALLERFADFVWSQRKPLNIHCADILRDGTYAETVLQNAIRVLIFLGEPSVFSLCDRFASQGERTATLATLAPAMLPTLCDRAHYERRALDSNLPPQDRLTALGILAAVGADLGPIYRQLQSTDLAGPDSEAWQRWFLMLCMTAPFAEAASLVEKYLPNANQQTILIVTSALMRLNELPGAPITDLLVKALTHVHRHVRLTAAAALTRRRSRAALVSLQGRYAVEDDQEVAISIAVAIAASGPRTIADLSHPRHDSPTIQLWKCIVAARTRDVTSADFLTVIACDKLQNWQLRRAAIFAAARLPYDVALERIVPVVMAERSPLTMDKTETLLYHPAVTSTILVDPPSMLNLFHQGRVRFVDFFADIFEQTSAGSLSPNSVPPGMQVAGWLYDELARHGRPATASALDAILDELNVPMLHYAVLRALRLSGQPEVIEAQIEHADYVWLAVKCLQERFRAEHRDPELTSRLRQCVKESPCRNEPLLDRIIVQHDGSAGPAPAGQPPMATALKEPPLVRIAYHEALGALSGKPIDSRSTLILDAVTKDEYVALVRRADPANDRSWGVETYVPSLDFSGEGHQVARRRISFTGESPAAVIRPVIAAANRFGVVIPWHSELISGSLAAIDYVPKFLKSIAVQGDRERFYLELGENTDALMLKIHTVFYKTPILDLIDERIVPFLSRYLTSGSDDFFETLCTLALKVDTAAVDPILSGLLYRWTQRFDLQSSIPQHDQNAPLWRGFARLSEHPRLDKVNGWQSQLTAILGAQLSWYHRQSVARVLERDPRSYSQIESLLFREANWQHFNQEEIDRLDKAADRLFTQLLEE